MYHLPPPPGMFVLSHEGCICQGQLYEEDMPVRRVCSCSLSPRRDFAGWDLLFLGKEYATCSPSSFPDQHIFQLQGTSICFVPFKRDSGWEARVGEAMLSVL